MVAALMVSPLSQRDTEITACFSFFVGLLNAGPGPVSYPDSVSSGVLSRITGYVKIATFQSKAKRGAQA
jgi:hypothetical protein